MGSRVTEVFRPQAIGANATVGGLRCAKMGGFLATAAGTLSAVDANGNTVLSAVPVAVGWNTIPFFFDTPVVSFTTASDAAGYLAI